jgi:hypothetical protein
MRFYARVCWLVLGCISTITFHASGQHLQTTDRISFSTIIGQESHPNWLIIRNTGSKPLSIEQLSLQGRNASQFKVQANISFPASIPPNRSLTIPLTFSPTLRVAPEIIQATLFLESNDTLQSPKTIMLNGLLFAGLSREEEPSLQFIVEALGYATDVGSYDLLHGKEATPIGNETRAWQFERADASQEITLLPLARFGTSGAIPFGYYFQNSAQLVYQKTGTLSNSSQEQKTLYPTLSSGNTTFRPDTNTSFGIFVSAQAGILHTEPSMNTARKMLRVYPARDSRGYTIPDTYLLCFEENAEDSDYQDYVFLLSNVRIVR